MKKRFFLFIGILLIVFSFVSAQNLGALTIFSENGERFYLLINGQLQNNDAQTSIRVDGLNKPNYTVKIMFEDKGIPEIRKSLTIADEKHVMMDVTYKIKRDRNGIPRLGFSPTVSIPYQPNGTAAAGAYVVHYVIPASENTK